MVCLMIQNSALIPTGVLIAVLAALSLAAVIGWGVKAVILEQRKRKRAYEALDEEQPDGEWQSVGAGVRAKQIKKRYLGRGNGFEYQFVVTFWTDNDDDVEFVVPQAFFESVTEDQIGTLVTLNGRFFDFGDGEKTSEAE